MKEAFQVIEKDPDDSLSEKKKVEVFIKNIQANDAAITAAKVSVLKDHRNDLDGAMSFMAGLISTMYTSAKSDYGSRSSSGKRRYVSATDSRDSRGRGRARRGGDGRGRDGRGRGRGGGYGGGRGGGLKKYMNGVDVSDPHRNFTSDEWTKLGPMRHALLLLRQASSGRGGRGGGRGDGQRSANASSAASAAAPTVPATTANTTNDQATTVSELTERGSQNGRGFGRGAYN